MSLLDRLADAHIQAAVDRGEFDDLPGAGKPQALDNDRHVPADLRAGYRMLKNAGFVPPEIADRHAIRDVEDLLAATEPQTAEADRLTRRLRWLETRLRASRRGHALLRHSDYGNAIQNRLAGDDSSTGRSNTQSP